MAEGTSIEWADDSVNFWWGCVAVGPGCDNCYAEVLAKRWGHDVWGVHKPRRIMPNAFKQIDRLQKKANKEGRRHRVFINSMSDLAEVLPDGHPQKEEIENIRWRFFVQVEQGFYPDLDLIWLTKRIGNVAKIVPPNWLNGFWPKNLWLVPTITDQKEADRDIPKLLAIPAKVRGLSIEPLLGEVKISTGFWWKEGCGAHGKTEATCRITGRALNVMDIDCHDCNQMPNHDSRVHWVICGGESGPNARPMRPDWARSLRDQCQVAHVPFFFKQWGEWLHESQIHGTIPDYQIGTDEGATPCRPYIRGHAHHYIHADRSRSYRVGKKRAGRLLDGRTWDELPGEQC